MSPLSLSSFARWVVGLSYLACIPAGVLWSLSPLGVRLSEYGFRTPNMFWKLFPSVPLLMIVGIVGLYVFRMERRTLVEKIGYFATLIGAAAVIAGDVGLYHLSLDDVFIMSAPFYRMFRIGLSVLTAGTLVFAFGAARSRSLPLWGTLPVVVTSLAGAISTVYDFGSFGAALWIAFGAGFAWLGFATFLQSVAGYLKKRTVSSDFG